jgi:hypothetical protein
VLTTVLLKPEADKTLLPNAARLKNEERLYRSEQKTADKPKHGLTGKAPYKFESSPLQR